MTVKNKFSCVRKTHPDVTQNNNNTPHFTILLSLRVHLEYPSSPKSPDNSIHPQKFHQEQIPIIILFTSKLYTHILNDVV